MIVVSFALPAESHDFLHRLRAPRVNTIEKLKIVSGTIDGSDVAVFHTGVGRSQSQCNIEAFVQHRRPEVLISSGFAGSLSEELEVGDVIVGENFSRADLVQKLFQTGAVWTSLERATATARCNPAELADRPQMTSKKFRAVKLVSLETMVHSPEDRAAIRIQRQADAVDMETEVIAQCCAGSGVRMLSVRVISDSSSAIFPAPPQILFDVGRQRTNFGRLIPYMLRHPAAAVRLVRFAGRISRVRGILTDALVEVIRIIA